MNEMSREASELVDAGREAFRPTEADRARLIAAVTGAATLSVGVAAAAGAQRSLSGIFSVVHAARVLAIVVPVAAAGSYWWHSTGPSPAPVQTALAINQPPAILAPQPAAPPVQATEGDDEDEDTAPPSQPSAPLASERGAPVEEASKPGNEIRQEVALLSKAQAALSRGRLQEALEALSEHAARFPRGALSEERTATRARTLCALGRRQEAEAELKRMEKLNPASAYLARARESCGSR
jgi:tetratricopeptide (TPR) repeat protein